MAYYFTHFSCVLDVGSAENILGALDLFESYATELDAAEGVEPGFDLEADDDAGPGALWLHGDGFGDPEHVIAFVLRCAEAFDLTGRWGFAWALTCSKPRLDGFGGSAQLIDLGARRSLACSTARIGWTWSASRASIQRKGFISSDPTIIITNPDEPGPRAGLRRFWRPDMGWLFMQSLGDHSGPRQYLDAQFTYERPERRVRVLRSSLVKMRTYYAAVEIVPTEGDREVFAVVCLVRYNPRDAEGYIFGYKDMDETMGPCEAECPAAILDLLTPTDRKHALAWRERCRAAARKRAAAPKLRDGDLMVFTEPIRFTNGSEHRRMKVVIDAHRPRAVQFRSPDSGGLYRIGGLDRLTFSIVRVS